MLANNKFTAGSLKALHALKGHPGWSGFTDLIAAEQTAIMERLVDTSDAGALRNLQGRAQALRDLMKFADHVGELLIKTGQTGL